MCAERDELVRRIEEARNERVNAATGVQKVLTNHALDSALWALNNHDKNCQVCKAEKGGKAK